MNLYLDLEVEDKSNILFRKFFKKYFGSFQSRKRYNHKCPFVCLAIHLFVCSFVLKTPIIIHSPSSSPPSPLSPQPSSPLHHHPSCLDFDTFKLFSLFSDKYKVSPPKNWTTCNSSSNPDFFWLPCIYKASWFQRRQTQRQVGQNMKTNKQGR